MASCGIVPAQAFPAHFRGLTMRRRLSHGSSLVDLSCLGFRAHCLCPQPCAHPLGLEAAFFRGPSVMSVICDVTQENWQSARITSLAGSEYLRTVDLVKLHPRRPRRRRRGVGAGRRGEPFALSWGVLLRRFRSPTSDEENTSN